MIISINNNPQNVTETNLPNIRDNFWQSIPLQDMNHAEWEALCDGCGVCCLIKFLEEDDNAVDVEYTDVACQLLDCNTGWCSSYVNRKTYVPDCISLTYEMLPKMMWLPNSCAYKRLYLGQPLPSWHFLLTNNKQVTHQKMQQAGISVAGRCISETDIDEEAIEERIIHWVNV